MTKYIIFDLGQVLVKVVFPEFVQKFAAEFEIDPSELTNNRNNGVHIDFMAGKVSPEEFHEKICKYFNHFISIERFRKLWLQMLGKQIDETALIVDELFEKQDNLVLLSNVDPWHFEYCEQNFPVLQKFSNKFVSFKLKMKKPDLEIYQHVAKQLKTKPKECLFIDDMLENIEAAKQVGFDGIQFFNAKQLYKELHKRGILNEKYL